MKWKRSVFTVARAQNNRNIYQYECGDWNILHDYCRRGSGAELRKVWGGKLQRVGSFPNLRTAKEVVDFIETQSIEN